MTRKALNGRVVVWIFILIGVVASGFLFYKGTQKDLTASSEEFPLDFSIVSMNLPNWETMGNFVVNSEKEWTTLAGASSSIDYAKNTALFMSMGQRMTGGYTIKVKSIVEKGNKIIAMVEFISPGKNCINIQVLTYPQLLVTIPKTNKEIEWVITNSVQDCPQ